MISSNDNMKVPSFLGVSNETFTTVASSTKTKQLTSE